MWTRQQIRRFGDCRTDRQIGRSFCDFVRWDAGYTRCELRGRGPRWPRGDIRRTIGSLAAEGVLGQLQATGQYGHGRRASRTPEQLALAACGPRGSQGADYPAPRGSAPGGNVGCGTISEGRTCDRLDALITRGSVERCPLGREHADRKS